MSFKVSAVLASAISAVSLAAHHNDDQASEDKPRNDGIGAPTYPGISEMLSEVLSFLPPFEWAGLRRVNSDFYACVRTTIGIHFEQHGVPLDPTVGFKAMVCSDKKKMEDVLKSVMDKPGFRGAIFNKDECTLINHSLRGSQVCSESEFKGKVRITGVADVEECMLGDKSRCNDIFLHRKNCVFRARNIRSGQEISFIDVPFSAHATLVNENQLVIATREQLLMYELNWESTQSKCVSLGLGVPNGNLSGIIVLTDQSGRVSSVIYPIMNWSYDVESKQLRRLVQKKDSESATFSPDGTIVCVTDWRNENLSIQTQNRKTTFLRLPGVPYFRPSPDSKFVGFEISSKPCIMNLRSSEITVIPDTFYLPDCWISDDLIRMRCNDGRSVLRCAHNPCVDVVTLNEDDSLIDQLEVGDEQDAGDLFHHLRQIGPNLYYSNEYRKVIQIEWIDKHDH